MQQVTSFSKKTLRLGNDVINLATPVCMGIINVTPDSFYAESRNTSTDLLSTAGRQLEEGATILDLGGYSSRPGAIDIPEDEEINRVIPALKTLIDQFPGIHVSVDTFRSEVARIAIEEGAEMINDISGGEGDEKMFDLVASKEVAYVMMHMRGTPQTMNQFTNYDNLIPDLENYFQSKLTFLEGLGVSNIVIDPGIGFAKTANQSLEIIKNLRNFDKLNKPVLVGVSRKSLIRNILEVSTEDALNGTTVLNTIALLNGASILRVHDVKPAVETIKLVAQL